MDYTIQDTVHGDIHITHRIWLLLQSPVFRRLGSIKQLGACQYIFTNAQYSRLDHSIGVYWLAGKLIRAIQVNTQHKYLQYCLPKGVALTNYTVELIQIAALCHDIGHGPFSHLFDDVLEELDLPLAHHEQRSLMLVDYLQNTQLPGILSTSDSKFIKSLIYPNTSQKSFIYEIVANIHNGLDVDKCDYIIRDAKILNYDVKANIYRMIESARVLNNHICYSESCINSVLNIFELRFYLHKHLYNDRRVSSVNIMLKELLLLLHESIDFRKLVTSAEYFIELTDESILSVILSRYQTSPTTNIVNAMYLLNQIAAGYYYTITETPTTTSSYYNKTIYLFGIEDIRHKLRFYIDNNPTQLVRPLDLQDRCYIIQRYYNRHSGRQRYV